MTTITVTSDAVQPIGDVKNQVPWDGKASILARLVCEAGGDAGDDFFGSNGNAPTSRLWGERFLHRYLSGIMILNETTQPD